LSLYIYVHRALVTTTNHFSEYRMRINVTMPRIWSFFLHPPPLHGLTYPTHGSSTGKCCCSSTVERSATTSSFFSEHNSLTEDPWKVGCSKLSSVAPTSWTCYLQSLLPSLPSESTDPYKKFHCRRNFLWLNFNVRRMNKVLQSRINELQK